MGETTTQGNSGEYGAPNNINSSRGYGNGLTHQISEEIERIDLREDEIERINLREDEIAIDIYEVEVHHDGVEVRYRVEPLQWFSEYLKEEGVKEEYVEDLSLEGSYVIKPSGNSEERPPEHLADEEFLSELLESDFSDSAIRVLGEVEQESPSYHHTHFE